MSALESTGPDAGAAAAVPDAPQTALGDRPAEVKPILERQPSEHELKARALIEEVYDGTLNTWKGLGGDFATPIERSGSENPSLFFAQSDRYDARFGVDADMGPVTASTEVIQRALDTGDPLTVSDLTAIDATNIMNWRGAQHEARKNAEAVIESRLSVLQAARNQAHPTRGEPRKLGNL
jgi:hypothetical protein